MENASKALIIAGAILISILLITIGVILINAGRDVTSTGTGQMNSQKIQTFNSQFTAYEGTRKGSEIKSLINAVNASNAIDSEHQISIYGPVANAGELNSTRSYTVTVHYYNGDKLPASDGQDQLKTMAGIAGGTGSNQQTSEKGYIDYITIN